MSSVVLHQSSAREMDDCPAKFRALRIDGLRPIFPPFARGQLVHTAIEQMTVESAKGNNDARGVGLAAVVEAAGRMGDEATGDVVGGALKIIEECTGADGWLRFGIPGRGQSCRVELPWALDENFNYLGTCTDEEPEPDGAAYAGRMDYLQWGDRGLIVRDYKSGFAWIKKDDVGDDWQARVYALAALAMFPNATSVTFEFWLLRHDHVVRHEFQRGESWEIATRAYLRSVRQRAVRADAGDNYPATPGRGCDATCPIRWKCDTYRNAILVGVLPDMDAPGLARLWLAAGILRSTAKGSLDDRLREIADADPIPVGDGAVVGFRPTTRRAIGRVNDDGTFKPFSALEILDDFRATGASNEELQQWFPGPSISGAQIRTAANRLAEDGREDTPAEYAKLFIAEVPSATFGAHTPPAEKPK